MQNNVKLEYGHNVWIKGNKCYRCEHEWKQENSDVKPVTCPKCKSPYWDKPKTRLLMKAKK